MHVDFFKEIWLCCFGNLIFVFQTDIGLFALIYQYELMADLTTIFINTSMHLKTTKTNK